MKKVKEEYIISSRSVLNEKSLAEDNILGATNSYGPEKKIYKK